MSGTLSVGTEHRMALRACYTMSGTDVGYSTTSSSTRMGQGRVISGFSAPLSRIGAVRCCPTRCPAMCGTDVGYAATRRVWIPSESQYSRRRATLSAYELTTRCPVLTQRTLPGLENPRPSP
eukprot:380665-Rhodomonas_salina.1